VTSRLGSAIDLTGMRKKTNRSAKASPSNERASMPYDETTVARVRRLLSKRRGVVEKRMIGGLCFMLGGSMCCGVNKDGLMVRVGADDLERTLAKPNVKPMTFGRRRLSGFVVVEPAGYRTEAALSKWIERGIAFATTLPSKKTGKVRL
jgi:hypothetical protein